MNSLQNLLKPTWYSIKDKLNSLMFDGVETCTHASYAVSNALQMLGISSRIIGGEFDESAHWWVETNYANIHYIVDFGNNILAGERDNSLLPIIAKKGIIFYKRYKNRDSSLTASSFRSYLKKIGMPVINLTK